MHILDKYLYGYVGKEFWNSFRTFITTGKEFGNLIATSIRRAATAERAERSAYHLFRNYFATFFGTVFET